MRLCTYRFSSATSIRQTPKKHCCTSLTSAKYNRSPNTAFKRWVSFFFHEEGSTGLAQQGWHRTINIPGSCLNHLSTSFHVQWWAMVQSGCQSSSHFVGVPCRKKKSKGSGTKRDHLPVNEQTFKSFFKSPSVDFSLYLTGYLYDKAGLGCGPNAILNNTGVSLLVTKGKMDTE